MAEAGPNPSANRQRALRLLTAGVIGGHLAGLMCVVAFWAFGGLESGMSAAIAAVVVIAFSTIGHAVQVLVADAPAKTVMIAALGSYGGRVSILGILLMLALDNAERFAAIDPVAVVVTTISVVMAWLSAEFWAFARLRIPVFDDPPQGPARSGRRG